MTDKNISKKKSWCQFLHHVKQSCSSVAFENWFKPITCLEEKQEEVILQVPNIFVKQYLLENYSDDLCHFLPLKGKGEPSIRFIVSTKKTACISFSPVVLPQPNKEDKKALFSSQEKKPSLIQSYTFDAFIEGQANEFAKLSATNVAQTPGKQYNPLFIHGGVGLGKTHLLHGIGHYIQTHHKQLKVQYITAEGFINDLISHLKNKSLDQMKHFYRSLDVLLIDDIQFLQNRPNFEEEFSLTFESLINQNKQVVIACDIPLNELQISERIRARMGWGLVAQINMPELEMRASIVQEKASQRNIHLNEDLAFFIAEKVTNNVRFLEGIINKICALSRLLNRTINQSLIESIFQDGSNQLQHNSSITIKEILEQVKEVFQVSNQFLQQKTRKKECILPRQVTMYLAKKLTNDPLTSIGAHFGKTHSTVIHACKQINKRLKQDTLLKSQIQQIEKRLQAQMQYL